MPWVALKAIINLIYHIAVAYGNLLTLKNAHRKKNKKT